MGHLEQQEAMVHSWVQAALDSSSLEKNTDNINNNIHKELDTGCLA